MTVVNGYATLSDVKSALRIADSVDDSLLELSIEAASREIMRLRFRLCVTCIIIWGWLLGMGGSARLDGVENLLTMCAYHNGLVESDALFRRLCVMRGYSVPRWAAGCVGSIPVEFLQGWMLLGDVLTPVDSRDVVEVFEDVYGYHDVIDF